MQMHANDANASNAMQKVNLHAKDAKEKEKEKEREKEKEKEKEKYSLYIGREYFSIFYFFFLFHKNAP